MVDIFLKDEAATQRAAHLMATAVKPGDIIGLVGNLGAGKTCWTTAFVQGLWDHAGGTNPNAVASPTFTLMNHYDGPAPIESILHVDLYRLNDDADLESTGYWDEVSAADLVIVEWIEHLDDAWPAPGLRVELVHDGEHRRLQLAAGGGAPKSVVERFAAALSDLG